MTSVIDSAATQNTQVDSHVRAYINGEWVDGSGGSAEYRSAYTDEVIGTYANCTPADVEVAIAAAKAAQPAWAAMPLLDRVDLFYRAYDICKERNEAIAQAISTEMGKTIHESREEMLQYGWGHFRRAPEDMLRFRGTTLPDSETRTNHMRSMTKNYPLGVVGVISPFNFPVDIAAIGITYALVAGNAVVWKPSEMCAGSTKIYAEIFEEAGFPPGVFNFVTGDGKAGNAIVESDDVQGLFFTGSTAVGKKIAEKSGLKRMLLELGGNGPIIVNADADIDAAVEATVNGCFYMAGQVCTAAERVLVHDSIHDAFVDKLVNRVRELKVGDPLDESTDMGPLANNATLQKVSAQVEEARDRGATIIQHGEPKGRLYPPTVLIGVTMEMEIAKQETFGPVAPIIRFNSVDEAIEIANDTEYGLNAAAFTNSMRDSWKYIDNLQHGTVLINESTNYWDQLAPFGGAKSSGLGRELSTDCLNLFTEKKTIVFNVS